MEFEIGDIVKLGPNAPQDIREKFGDEECTVGYTDIERRVYLLEEDTKKEKTEVSRWLVLVKKREKSSAKFKIGDIVELSPNANAKLFAEVAVKHNIKYTVEKVINKVDVALKGHRTWIHEKWLMFAEAE